MKKLIAFFFLISQFSYISFFAMDNSVREYWLEEFKNRATELQNLKSPPLYFSVLPVEIIQLTAPYYISANNNSISFDSPSYVRRLQEEYKARERREFYYSLMSSTLKITGIAISVVALICAIGYIKDLPMPAQVEAGAQAAKLITQETTKKVVQSIPAAANPVMATVSSAGARAASVANAAARNQQLLAEAYRIYPILKMRGKNLSIAQICYLLAMGVDPLRR